LLPASSGVKFFSKNAAAAASLYGSAAASSQSGRQSLITPKSPDFGTGSKCSPSPRAVTAAQDFRKTGTVAAT